MSLQKERLDLFAETLRLAFVRRGAGRVFLLLHGGAGAGSMLGLAEALAAGSCAVLPTHPGFDGEPRPERFTRIDDLVLVYLTFLERLDLKRVVLVGNSIGGWLAAELALRKSPRIAGAVLLDAVGIDTGSPDRTIPDPDEVPPAELMARAFHDPQKLARPPTPEEAATLAENQRSLRIYAGRPFMHDPGLRARLAGMWRFEVLPMAGHLPQIERLEDTRRLVEDFAATL